MSGKFIIEIPPHLLDPGAKDEFLMWLAQLPVDVNTKKYILLDWCRLTGVQLTLDMVEYIAQGRPENTWG